MTYNGKGGVWHILSPAYQMLKNEIVHEYFW